MSHHDTLHITLEYSHKGESFNFTINPATSVGINRMVKTIQWAAIQGITVTIKPFKFGVKAPSLDLSVPVAEMQKQH